MKIKQYLVGLLALNVMIFAVFGGVLWNFNSLIKESTNKSTVSSSEETDKALGNSSIMTLESFSNTAEDFDKDIIIQGVKHDACVNLLYTKADGTYVSFDDVIQKDGSVTGVVLLLSDSSKAYLYMDTLSLVKDKYSTSDEDNVQVDSIHLYESYLAKQLGLTITDANVFDKYTKDNAQVKSGTSLSFAVGVGTYLILCTVFSIVILNIVALVLGIFLCKSTKVKPTVTGISNTSEIE